MTDTEKKLIADMIDVGDKMYLRGFVAANDGNLSVRCPDGECALAREQSRTARIPVPYGMGDRSSA